MKKLISLALTLAMLCCMATTASAARVVGDPNGVESFDPASGGTHVVQIDVTTNSVQHRYAVDVEYTASAVEIGGDTLTWNVNTFTYDVTPGVGGDKTDPINKEITVKNYSDMPVKVATTANKNYPDAPFDLTVTNDNIEIAKATATSGGTFGSATPETITVKLTPNTTWGAVAAYLAGQTDETTITIAQATLQISMVP